MIAFSKSVITAAFVALSFVLAPGSLDHAHANGKIAASVNSGIVTVRQVTQRAKFLTVTGFKGNAREQALEELVTEEIQLQEAKRVDFAVRDSTVDQAFGSIARRLKLSPSQFSTALRQRGVNPSTLRQRLRAQITWQQLVAARARSEGGRQSSSSDITSILFNRGGAGKNRKVQEYTIDRFVFVVKRDSSESVVRQRFREAEAFRRTYSSCEGASERANALKDVVVTKLGRFTTDTLPAEIKEDVLNGDVGTFTKPQRGELGVGLMAICGKREIVDNRDQAGAGFNAGQLSTQELQQRSKQYMSELRSLSNIRIRN